MNARSNELPTLRMPQKPVMPPAPPRPSVRARSLPPPLPQREPPPLPPTEPPVESGTHAKPAPLLPRAFEKSTLVLELPVHDLLEDEITELERWLSRRSFTIVVRRRARWSGAVRSLLRAPGRARASLARAIRRVLSWALARLKDD